MANPFLRLGLLHVLNDGMLASLPLLLPFMQQDLGLDFESIGWLSSILASAGVVLALPSARIARRFGGFRVLGMALLLYSLAFILASSARGGGSLTVAFMLASVGFGLFHPIAFALVAHGSSAQEVGKKMGDFTAVGDLGRIGFAAAATLLVAVLSWRQTAIIYGVLPLLTFALFFHRSVVQLPVEARCGAAPHGLRSSKNFIMAVIAGGLDALASSSIFIFIPFLLVHRNIPTALLGALTGAFFVGNMLGKVLVGRVVDRLGCFRVFVVSEIAMAVLLFYLSIETATTLIALFSILLGAVTKGTVPVINTMVTNSVPDRALYEKAFGIVSFVGGVAAVIAPSVYGLIAERFGIVAVFQLCACFALLAVVPGVLQRMLKQA
jgi:MFS transporter, FSR family, fosmidomycin resistance protein